MAAGIRHVRIDLGYDGTAFFGSQRQSERRTVQQEIEVALKQLTSRDVRLAFAGRTDRGVHAVGQVASGSLAWRRDDESLRFALDSLTPDDVSITGVQTVEEGFHARYSARSRVYRYRIWNGPTPPAMLRRFVWHQRAELNLAAMNAVAQRLIGEHDFASFAGDGIGVPGSGVDCTRTVLAASWRSLTDQWEPGGAILEFEIRANGFLPHMVRNIVGNICAVGQDRARPEWFEGVIARRDRRQAEPPAPPQGLVLWSVEYPNDAG
ncbi:MAG TPA: tRNA pseudouridine(38-40) synthase TruA [Nitrolancea sp.]